MKSTIYKTVAVEIEISKMNYIYRDCILYGSNEEIENELNELQSSGTIDIYEEKEFRNKQNLELSIRSIKNIFSKDSFLQSTEFINCTKENLQIAN